MNSSHEIPNENSGDSSPIYNLDIEITPIFIKHKPKHQSN